MPGDPVTAPPELSTARLRLFVPDAAWAAESIAFFGENRTHLEPWGPPMPAEMFTIAWWEGRFRQNEAERLAGRSVKLVFTRHGDRRILGGVSLFDITRGTTQSAVIGYNLARDAQGHGYMTEAAGAVVDFAFRDLALHRLYTWYDVENVRSANVLARLGFEVECRIRKARFLRGGWRDEVQVGRLAPDPDAPPTVDAPPRVGPAPIAVHLVPHDLAWAALARREAERIEAALGDNVVCVHHIGSTSIPGIVAKPVLDLMPVVRDLAAIDVGRLVAAGYEVHGEAGIAGRCFVSRDEDGMRRAHVHCFAERSQDVTRHLAFRDYLRAHPLVAAEYADEKRRARDLHPADSSAYNAAKSPWVARVEAVALAWHRNRA